MKKNPAIFSGFVQNANRVLNMHFQVGEPCETGRDTSKRVFTPFPYIIVLEKHENIGFSYVLD